MDFLKDDVKKLYFTYLRASIFSALITGIYSFVDTIAVGQSVGAAGTAAMAVISPFYGLVVVLGLVAGIGGSVLMNNARARGEREEGDRYFTSAMILIAILTAVLWAVFLLFPDPILTFFGADAETLATAKEYTSLIFAFIPVYVIPMSVSAFVRNDGAPGHGMAAVAIGGALNIFGDWFFVFPLGMGMRGAAIATVLGNSTQSAIILSYLFRKKCTLRFRKPEHLWKDIRRIFSMGLGAGLPDFGSVVTSIIINNQLMRYSGATALAVFGAATTISNLFQAMYSGVGQAIQPIATSNYAVGQRDRVNRVMRMAAITAGAMGIVFTALGELFPKQIVSIFIDATPEVLEMAPAVVRLYFPFALFAWINVLAIYYLQSVLRDKAALAIGLCRSLVVSSILLLVLPLIFGLYGVLAAIPLAELLVAIGSAAYTKKIQPELYQDPEPGKDSSGA